MTASAGFIVEDFKRAIDDQGYNARWEQAIICECYQHGQPDIHCKLCQGRGWRYLPPRHIKVISTSFSGKQELTVPGLKQPGTVYLTPQVGITMGYHDKVDFYEVTANHSQVLKMGNKETSASYRPIREVLFVMIGQNVYEEEVDFKISKDRHHLIWIDPTTKPLKGSNISLLYSTSPQYVITDMIHELRSVRVFKDTVAPYTAEMPKQYQGTRIDFIYGHTINAKTEEAKEKEGNLIDSIRGGEFSYG